MPVNVRTKDSTGEIIRFSVPAFDDAAATGETDQNLPLANQADIDLLTDNPPKILRVDAGHIRLATGPELTTQANTNAAERLAQFPNTSSVRIFANTAALPLPPPRAGLLVLVTDAGAGSPGVAISETNRWVILNHDSFVGP